MRLMSATNIHLNFWCMSVHNSHMDNDELKPEPQPEGAEPVVEADGYYGEGDTGTEDLDLSFLDEDAEEEPPAKPAA